MGRPRKKKGRPISGWLILDKPYNYGSTEAVSKIKWLFKAQKAGHAGTLDPLASGMLPIALGDATKTVPYVMDGRKNYQFTITWGEERNTDDMEGEIIETSDNRPQISDIEAILPNYLGTIMQKPPLFSAIKIAGERAYDMARGGQTPDIPAREVQVHRLTLLGCPDENSAQFEVECGKGTYVRAFARDFGRDLGCFGYISQLRRPCVMPFSEDQLVSLDDLVALEKETDDKARLELLDQYIIGTGEALTSLPHLPVSSDQASRISRGNSILIRGRDAFVEEAEAYATDAGRLIAIGEIAQGEFRPKRVFN